MLAENVDVQPVANDKQGLLLIDDDPSVISALRLLFKADYDTYEAATVGEGLRLFSLLHPPVVFLDL